MILMQSDDDKHKKSALIIVIEPDNLERMKNGDPITLNPKDVGGFLEPIKYPENFGVFLSFEADPGRCYELQSKPQELLQYLMRGWKFNALDGTKVAPADVLRKASS
jgi:hypothetical protein